MFRFAAATGLIMLGLSTAVSASPIYTADAGPMTNPLGSDLESKLRTIGDPSLALITNDNEDTVLPGFNFDGVATLFFPGASSVCTATLLNPRQAITAAHCFGDPLGDGTTTGLETSGFYGLWGDADFGALIDHIVDGSDISLAADQITTVQSVDINPLWLGSTGGTNPDGTADVTGDGDIAVVTFNEWIGRTSYDILLEDTLEEFFQPHIRVGRGTAGALTFGQGDEFLDLQRRIGFNEYELFASNFAIGPGAGGFLDETLVAGSRLLYDCDDGSDDGQGLPATLDLTRDPDTGEAIFNGFAFPSSLGLGADEACADGGDSGSGNFIIDPFTGDLQIVGVTSFGSGVQQFGGIGGDTRTAAHAAFLQSVLIPVPGAVWLLGLGVAGVAVRRRRKAA